MIVMYASNLLINYVLLILFILVSISFLTLLERKVLSYMQMRVGPNKVSILGILQPISDGIKLFSKEFILIKNLNLYYYYISPMISFFLSLSFWLLYPYMFNLLSLNLGVIYFICLLSMNVYPMMIAGWSSNSLYSLLGSLRSIAQSISYEISLVLILLGMLLFIESMNLKWFFFYQINFKFIIIYFPLSLMLFVSLMAELNRTPYDFSEGESELVSGFNIEYMSSGFSLIFMAEYGNIIFMMMIFTILNFSFNSFMFEILWSILIYLVIWIRATFPRFRYDKLMYMVWLSYLPNTLNYLIFLIVMKYLIILII